MARKFLYVIAAIAVLTIAGGFALNIWSKEFTKLAFVPSTDFVEQAPLETNAYADRDMWFSRPGIGTDDPARWQPAFAQDLAPNDTAELFPSEPIKNAAVAPIPKEPEPDYAVFFVHPTSYLERAQWNAPLDDVRSQRFARLFLRGLSSPFNGASEIWAPRYRQATVGAFLTDAPEAGMAIDAAYRDIEQAFDVFISTVDEDTPIVLAGHSQGSVHLLRLLQDRIADSDLRDRVAAVYAIGWPISVERDLPALPFPACTTAQQDSCIVGWASFAEPADPAQFMDVYRASTGFDGQIRGDGAILCVNPITGTVNGMAPAAANLGTLVPSENLRSGELIRGAIPAKCDESGLLLIGDPPEMGSAVLPGNNYHVYDIPLFWSNLKADVTRRVGSFTEA